MTLKLLEGEIKVEQDGNPADRELV